ncbi:PLDc N-terminal domain-containing protein [Parapedobacter sp. DT-150]|uniref:PLDc N-terminal domain-containing protein n=1 Tax=Parapedobacter sp. DT-150 TaxID=3396162 RepID=UPI003F192E3D
MELLFLNLGTPELVFLFLAIPVFLACVFGLIHCIANDNIPGANRVLWCLVILALPLIGTIAYWVVGRKPTGRVAG